MKFLVGTIYAVSPCNSLTVMYVDLCIEVGGMQLNKESTHHIKGLHYSALICPEWIASHQVPFRNPLFSHCVVVLFSEVVIGHVSFHIQVSC